MAGKNFLQAESVFLYSSHVVQEFSPHSGLSSTKRMSVLSVAVILTSLVGKNLTFLSCQTDFASSLFLFLPLDSLLADR